MKSGCGITGGAPAKALAPRGVVGAIPAKRLGRNSSGWVTKTWHCWQREASDIPGVAPWGDAGANPTPVTATPSRV